MYSRNFFAKNAAPFQTKYHWVYVSFFFTYRPNDFFHIDPMIEVVFLRKLGLGLYMTKYVWKVKGISPLFSRPNFLKFTILKSVPIDQGLQKSTFLPRIPALLLLVYWD